MSRWSRSPSAFLTAAAAGAAAFLVLAAVFALGPCGVAKPGSFAVALASGTLVGVTALMLLGSRAIGDDDTRDFDAKPCAACGAPLVDEWRLCPHCGEMLECDTRHPSELGNTSSI